MIDKDEYPQTAADRDPLLAGCSRTCGTRPIRARRIGTSTIGSSEACMLGGLALKRRWQHARRAAGRRRRSRTLSSARARAGVLGEILQLLGRGSRALCRSSSGTPGARRPRPGPVRATRTPSASSPIMGVTYTGVYEPVARDRGGPGRDPGTHAASTSRSMWTAPPGAMIAPFLQPELVWDFRLAAGRLDQHLRPQIRPGVPGPRLGRVAGRRGAP